jgi:hypothetical protein
LEGKAKILLFGYSDEEVGRITEALEAVGVPPPGVLRPTQGSVRLSEIILHGKDGAESLSSDERLVLFHKLSEAGVGTLVRYIRGVEVPRPIFAVVTETSFRWTLAELLEHLVAEKRAFEAARQAPPGGPDSSLEPRSSPEPPEPERLDDRSR